MTEHEFRELLDRYKAASRQPAFQPAITATLGATSVDDLQKASAAWAANLGECDYDKLDAYTAQIVTYSAEIDRTYDERLSRLLTFTLSLAGFSVAYLVAILNLPAPALVPTYWGAVVLLVTCSAVWLVSILAVDPYYSHRRLGWSPYYFLYNVGLKYHRPRLLARWSLSTGPSQQLSDQAFVMDVAAYRDRLSRLVDPKARFLANAEQAVMLFHVTITKSWSLSIIKNVLMVGLVIGGVIYMLGLGTGLGWF